MGTHQHFHYAYRLSGLESNSYIEYKDESQFTMECGTGIIYLWLWLRFFRDKLFKIKTNRNDFAKPSKPLPNHYRSAIITGLLFSVTMISLFMLCIRLFPINFGTYNLTSVESFNKYLYLFMIAVTAAISEEVAFRGYLQTRLGAVVSLRINLIICSVVFSIVHAAHPEFIYVLPIYFFYSYYLGLISNAVNSTVPSIIVHTITDFTIFMLFMHFDINKSNKLWDTGIDFGFIVLILTGAIGLIGGSKLYQKKLKRQTFA